MSKNTVKTYLLKLYQLKMHVDDLLLLDDPELEKKFHEGNPAYKDPRFEYIKKHLDDYRKDLEDVGVTKRLLGKNTGNPSWVVMAIPSFAIT